MAAACTTEKDGFVEKEEEPQKEADKIEFAADFSSPVFDVDGGSTSITFMTNTTWTASVSNTRSAAWCSVSPSGGAAGTVSLTVKTEANDSPDDRTAIVRINAGKAEKSFLVSQKQKDALTVTQSRFDVAAEGGDVVIEVKANIDYTYEIEETAASWIKAVETKALSTTKVGLSVAVNDDLAAREGKIIIKSGEFNEVVTICQEGGEPTLVISQKEYELDADGGELKIEISSNFDVGYSIVSADWIKERVTKSMSTHTYVFDVAENESAEAREGEIVFSASDGSLSQTVTVKQLRKGAIFTSSSSNRIEATNRGGEFEIEYNPKSNFTIDIITNPWVKVERKSDRILRLKVAENIYKNNRTGFVLLRDQTYSIIDTVYVEQKGGLYYEIAQKEFRLSYEETDIQITVDKCNENVFSFIETSCDWIKWRSGSTASRNGVYEYNQRYRIEANNTSEDRTGEIYMKNKSTNKIVDTVFVIQSPHEVIITSKQEYKLSEKGGEFDIEYRTEYDCGFSVPDDCNWVSVSSVSTKAFADKKVHVKVSPNNTGKDRQTSIDFSVSSQHYTIDILQAAKGAIKTEQTLYELSEMSQTLGIAYSSNIDVFVDIPEECDWVSLAGDSGDNLQLQIKANEEENDRETELILHDYSGECSEIICIKQIGRNYYLRCPNNVTADQITYACNYKEQRLAHYVESDGDYKFEIETEDPSWIRYVRTEKVRENVYNEVYELDENTTGKERVCTLRFSLGNIVLEYRLAQTEQRTLTFSQTEFNVSSEGGSFPVEITAVGEWAKNISPFYDVAILSSALSWLSLEGQSTQHGIIKDTPTLVVKSNYTNKQRSGSIRIRAAFGEEYHINVNQTAEGAIVLTGDSYILDSGKHDIDISLATSDYTVEVDGDAKSWISTGEKKGEGENTRQQIIIAENTTGKERKGSILFVSGTTKNKVSFTQLMSPPELVDDTPEKWHSFPLPKVNLILTNPGSEGSQIYEAIVPNCEELVHIASRKVLDCLYSDPNDKSIPRPTEMDYVLEDYDGVSYNVNMGEKIGLSNQYLAQYYHQHGAEAMIKENIGILTHEITHSYQSSPKNCGGYTPGTHYFAFIEGVADAVRVLCGGFPNDSDRPRGGHYMDAYRHGGFFIAWLVNNKDADFLRKFNESARVLDTWTFEAGVKYALGENADAQALWIEYQKAMGDI